jgi:2-haloacid dehalogenase
MKKVVVFDFGGVLIDWSPYYLYRKLLPDDEAVKAFLDEVGFACFNARLDCGLPFTEFVKEYSRKFPQHRALIEAYYTRWAECTGEAISGSVELLRKVKSNGYPVYGLSNWSAESFQWIKNRFDFLNELDEYLLSGVAGHAKPGEELFNIFLERIGRPAEECLFIDDSLANIETAHRLGFSTIHFHTPAQLALELSEMGVISPG